MEFIEYLVHRLGAKLLYLLGRVVIILATLGRGSCEPYEISENPQQDETQYTVGRDKIMGIGFIALVVVVVAIAFPFAQSIT